MAISPMMQNYLQIKENYMDCILFFRLGDFYEFFFDDAILVSKVLDLTLTGKDCGLDKRAPMCGMPYHSAQGYIQKLVDRGYKVAICEQLSQPKKGEMVKRDVVRIITPGTVVDAEMLEEKRNNYIACIYDNIESVGLSYCDLSTGEFSVSNFEGPSCLKMLNDALVRVLPTEIIYKSERDLNELQKSLSICAQHIAPEFGEPKDPFSFDYVNADNLLKEQFGEDYQHVYDMKKSNESVCSAGALMNYLRQTQKRVLEHINTIKKVDNKKYMIIDLSSRKNLEILERMKDRKKRGSLIGCLDKTKTPMGGRLFRTWLEQPLCEEKEINARLDAVEEFYSNLMLRDNVSMSLHYMNDIERIAGRIAYGNFNPRDCIALKESLKLLPNIKASLEKCKSSMLCQMLDEIADYHGLVDLLTRAIDEKSPAQLNNGGIIKAGYSEQLDNYRNARNKGKEWLNEYEAKEREQTGIKNLKVGYNRVFGYFIEVNKSLLANVPLSYVRKQTISNNERFITEELKELEEQILGSDEKALSLEIQLFEEIRGNLKNYVRSFQRTAQAIAKLDCLVSFAEIAIKNNYVKPKVSKKSQTIRIVGGRHPVVEDILNTGEFIANDTYLNGDTDNFMIITGPNMAGKSTYMRQVAVITLMAHAGCFVPAKEAEICLTDRIFTRVGASDDLAFGQSTFMVEMNEVAQIIENATEKSLIVLDEIGRGTSTFDGLSIAWAVVEYIVKNIKAKTLFATHYHELTELESILKGVKNYKISVKEINGTIVFLRKIVRGGANKSFGVEVASLAGVHQEIIDRAKEISVKLEQSDINKNILEEVNEQKVQTVVLDKKIKEVVSILKDLDINKISPLSAFEILNDLTEKLK